MAGCFTKGTQNYTHTNRKYTSKEYTLHNSTIYIFNANQRHKIWKPIMKSYICVVVLG